MDPQLAERFRNSTRNYVQRVFENLQVYRVRFVVTGQALRKVPRLVGHERRHQRDFAEPDAAQPLSGGATLLNRDIAAGGPGLSAFCAHSGFSFCSNPEANTADHHTDTWRRAFLNNPTSFRRRFLNDVVVGKCRRCEESCEGGTGQNCAHEKSPFKVHG